MTRIQVDTGEVELDEVTLKELLAIAAQVASGRMPVMDAREVGGWTVDVGGRGVAYSVIRLRRGEDTHKINPTRAEKLVEQYAPELLGADAAAARPQPDRTTVSIATPMEAGHRKHHREASSATAASTEEPVVSEQKMSASERDATMEQLVRYVADLAAGADVVVTEAEIQKVTRFAKDYSEKGGGQALEQALLDLLQSPKTPPLLKARLAQHAARLAIPRVSAALAGTLKDPRLQNFIRDKRLYSLFQKVLERAKSSDR